MGIINLSLHEISLARQFFLDIFEGGYLGLGLLDRKHARVVGVELREGVAVSLAFLEILVVVQSAVVGRHAVEIAEVFRLGAFLVGEQRLVELLAVANANHLDVFLLAAEQLAHRLGLRLYGAGGGFLHEDIAVLPVLEGEEHEVDGLLERHDEAGHRGLGQGDGVAVADLVNPQGNHGAAAAHHVAVARAADFRAAGIAALGHGDFLLDGLGDAHGVDGIGGLVGGEADDGLHAGLDGGGQHVVGAYHVGLHGLHREKLAGGHLLQRGGVEDVVHAGHGALARLQAAHVADVEFYLVRHVGVFHLVLVAHVVLLLLVA